MLWFLLAIILSQLITLFLPALIEETMDFVTIVLMFFLIANLVSSERKLEITYYILVLLTVTLAVSGIVQSFTGVGLGGQEMYKGSRIRGIGIFSDPNDLALASASDPGSLDSRLSLSASLGEKNSPRMCRTVCISAR